MPGPLTFLDFLTSREQAGLVCGALVFGYAAYKSPSALVDMGRLLGLFLTSKLAFIYEAALLYSAAIVYAAYEAGVWQLAALKATIYWFIVTAVVLIGEALTGSPYDDKLIRRAAPRIAGVSVLLEFSMNLYVLPFPAELVVVFVVAVFASLDLLAARAPSADPAVRKAINGVLVTLGFIFFMYFIARVVADPDGFLTRRNAEDLFVGPALTIALLPFLYAAAFLSWRDAIHRRASSGSAARNSVTPGHSPSTRANSAPVAPASSEPSPSRPVASNTP